MRRATSKADISHQLKLAQVRLERTRTALEQALYWFEREAEAWDNGEGGQTRPLDIIRVCKEALSNGNGKTKAHR